MTLGTAALAAIVAQLVEPPLGAQWLAIAAGCVVAVGVCRVLAGAGLRPLALVASLVASFAATRPLGVPTDVDHVAQLAAGEHAARSYAVEARVLDVVPSAHGGARWLVATTAHGDASRAPLHGRALVYVRTNAPAVAIGTRVALASRFRPIRGFGNPGELDWPGWNARRGVFVSAYIWDGGDVAVLASESSGVRDRLAALRARVTQAATDGYGRGGVLVAALVTGERRLLSDEDTDAMTAAGLAHVLAISGLNLSLVGGAVTLIIARLLLRTRAAHAGFDTMRIAVLAGLVATLGYAAISGGGVSVARATMMAAVVAASLWHGRSDRAGTGLAGAALALSLAMPGIAREAGFQLSFAAVAAILVYGLRPTPSTVSSKARALGAALEISILCWAVSTPIVAQHFGRDALYGATATLATAPLAGGIVGLGLAGAALVAVGAEALAQIAFAPAAYLAVLLHDASAWIAALPFAEIKVVSPGPLLAATLSLLPCAVLLRREFARPLAVGLLATSLALILHAYHARYAAGSLDVHFLSVGQGDAAVARLPGGYVVVVDGGPLGRGAMVLAPYLRRLHIARVDTWIITHAQDDHYGGVGEVLDDVEVGELWSPSGECDVAAFAELRRHASDRGAKWLEIGEEPLPERSGPGWRLAVLWPDGGSGRCNENDRSVVSAIEYAGQRVLLAGDVEARAEQALVLAHGGRLDADVIAAPHHGSRTSSTAAFVHATSPSWVVASAGQGNRYGFPRPETLARYRAAGAVFLTTAEVGAVQVRIADGEPPVVRVGARSKRVAPR